MKRSWLTLTALLLAALWAPLTSRASGETPANSYTVIALGGTRTAAYGINDVGQVVGQTTVGYGQYNTEIRHAFLWQNGTLTDLGTLVAGGSSGARAVNNAGLVAGHSDGRACLWQNGRIRDLGTLPGGRYSAAMAVNEAGQVAGYADVPGPNGTYVWRAFLWGPVAGMRGLGTLGGAESHAFGINDAGQVAGQANTADGVFYPFVWTPDVPNGAMGVMNALGAAPGTALDINNSGWVAGPSILWDPAGSPEALEGIRYEPSYSGTAVLSDLGQVVGYDGWCGCDEYTCACEYWAVRWDGTNGSRDLNALLASGYPQYYQHLDRSTTISRNGHIAAINDYYSFALIPSPVPAPPRLYGAQAEDGQVRLWHLGSLGATSYNIARSTQAGGPYTRIAAGITGNSYTDTSVVNGTQYHYVVAAVNAYGESGTYGELTAMPNPPPTAPGGLAAAAGDQQVTLSWTASAGAEYYSVWRSTTRGGPYTPVDYAYETRYVDSWLDPYSGTPLENGTTYYYVVTAVNYIGDSPPSNEASATPSAETPPSPILVLGASPGDRRVTLSWEPASGADSYTVKRAAASGGPYATIATRVTSTGYTDTGLTNGTPYCYVATAVNQYGESVPSNEVKVIPRVPAPEFLHAWGRDARVELSWAVGPAGLTYNVKRSTASGGPYTTIATRVPPASYLDRDVVNGTRYYYVVSAVNELGDESAHTSEQSALPLATPRMPTGLSASGAKGRVNLKWTQSTSPGIHDNRIYRSTISGSGYTQITEINAGTSFTDTAVTRGRTYYYVVTAVNNNGQESPNSNQASAQPK